MKKLFIFIIFIFCFLLILLLSLFSHSSDEDVKEKVYVDYSQLILDNSSWITFTKNDFNSLLLKTYSENILTIINLLENSNPVIIEVNGGKFAMENKNNFIVASSFDANQKVHIYLSNGSTYTKTTSSLEELLENAVRVLVINNEEVLK